MLRGLKNIALIATLVSPGRVWSRPAEDSAGAFQVQVTKIEKLGWQKVRSGGISNPLFQAFSQYDEKTSLVAMRFITVIDYPIDIVASLWFANNELKTQWMDLTDEFLVLAQVSDHDFIHQVITKAVFPAAARTFISKASIYIDPKRKLIKGYSSAFDDPNRKIPEHLVLGRVHYSHTFMQEVAVGKTSLDLSVLVDPGGWIPAFIANAVATSWPAKTYQGLLKELGSGRVKVVRFFD